MQPSFENISAKLIVGQRLNMSFSQNKTGVLWQRFMPLQSGISNQITAALYSVEVYPVDFFNEFTPDKEFEKWAGVEITGTTGLPEGVELLNIPAGLYAIFTHTGPASAGPATYQYIFGVWLPASGYAIDNRPHFALMTEKYKHEQEDSEEDIYIPVKVK